MSLVALIPARKGSKGIPNKNIVDLFGQPLISWTITKALKSECFDSVFVSTDCEEIANIAEKYGANIPYIRPSDLAKDCSTKNEVISDFLMKTESVDQIVWLQPTSPFRSIKAIQKFKSFICKNSIYPIVSVCPVSNNPSTVLINNKNGDWNFMDTNFTHSRQENSSKIFKMDGSFFYIERNYWYEMKDKVFDFFRTKDTRFFLNTEDGPLANLDIDEKSDLEFARTLFMN